MRSLHHRHGAQAHNTTTCRSPAARSQELARGMDHGERRRSGAHGAAARTWRGGGAGAGGGGALPPPPPPPPPPKVYRVEPRDFRELVQRLTGAGASATAAPSPAAHLAAQQRAMAPAMVAESRRPETAAVAPEQQFDYASWYSAMLLSPAYGAAAGYGGHQGNGPLL